MEISESEKNFAIAEDINLKRSKLVGLMGAKDYGTWVFNLDKEMTAALGDKKQSYNLWHVFVGGGYSPECELFDLEGEFSIQKIINDKIVEYEKRKKS